MLCQFSGTASLSLKTPYLATKTGYSYLPILYLINN